jgi:hypothetical protein
MTVPQHTPPAKSQAQARVPVKYQPLRHLVGSQVGLARKYPGALATVRDYCMGL